MTTPIRVLVVEDHLIARIGITTILNTQPDIVVVAEAATGERAIELQRRHTPDVTLMDVRLPGMNGNEAIRAIREESPSARVIALTTYDTESDLKRALQAGAAGFLVKDVLDDELLTAIRTVHAGRRFVSRRMAMLLADPDRHDELSDRELDVLDLIVRGKTNKDIAAILSIAETTVKSHVQNILSKLGVDDRTSAATLALCRGIVRLD